VGAQRPTGVERARLEEGDPSTGAQDRGVRGHVGRGAAQEARLHLDRHRHRLLADQRHQRQPGGDVAGPQQLGAHREAHGAGADVDGHDLQAPPTAERLALDEAAGVVEGQAAGGGITHVPSVGSTHARDERDQ
jgi:hypothetical protein